MRIWTGDMDLVIALTECLDWHKADRLWGINSLLVVAANATAHGSVAASGSLDDLRQVVSRVYERLWDVVADEIHPEAAAEIRRHLGLPPR